MSSKIQSSTIQVSCTSFSFKILPFEDYSLSFGLKPNPFAPQMGRTARPATESSESSRELVKMLLTMESHLLGNDQ